jgi:hypothetical protein
VVPPRFVDEATRIIINPSGRWVEQVAVEGIELQQWKMMVSG